MSTAEIEQSALLLPVEERLHLARRLVESIDDARVEQASIDEGVRRLEDLVTGKVAGVPLDEFLRRLG
jgi:putative addiction module component (TIGR02574 family)